MTVFSAGVKKAVCTCILKKVPGKCFSKFYVFVSCLEQGLKTILAWAENQLLRTQKLVSAMFFKLFPLGEVLGFLTRNFQLLSAKKLVNIHVTRVQPEKFFKISKSLEVFLSFYRKLFPLAISNSTITVHKNKFGKSSSWKIITKSNKNCCSNNKLSICVFKTNF